MLEKKWAVKNNTMKKDNSYQLVGFPKVKFPKPVSLTIKGVPKQPKVARATDLRKFMK